MNGTFFMVYKDLLHISDLTLTDLLILSTLIKYDNEDKLCYLTTKDFMYDCNATRRTIERSFKHLKEMKLIAILKINGKYAKMLCKRVLEKKLGYDRAEEENATRTILEGLEKKWQKK